MGQRIGIIAGSGELPARAAAEALRLGFDVAVAAVRGEADPGIAGTATDLEWFGPGELEVALAFLARRGVVDVLLAGKVGPEAVLRPSPADPAAARVLAAAADLRPARLVGALIGLLEARGFKVLDPTPFLAGGLVPPGVLTRTLPSPAALRDIERGFSVARRLADLDAGQTVVVRDGAVVALEGAEGTDRAILRGGQLAGPGTVAVKVARTDQDPRIDLPGVGLGTVRSLAEARASTLAFEAGRVVLFQKEEALALADAHGIAVVATGPPGAGRPSRRET